MARATAAVRLMTGEREPVRLATTANLDTVIVDGVEKIVGLKTIDGLLTSTGDRILVKNQTTATLNGIYTASVGYWSRASDARSSRTMQKGTTVHVQLGSTNAGSVYSFQTDRPNIGTDNIVLGLFLSAGMVDTDGTLAANSNNRVPSQAAVVTYVGAAIAALRGGVAAAGDTLAKLYALITNHTSNTSNPHLTTAAQLGLGTGDSPQFTGVNLGHATDTTLSRGAAGFVAVEGKRVPSPASQAAGDLLYRGSTEWERLAKGTAAQVLTMNAGATAPEWQAASGTGLGVCKAWINFNGSGTPAARDSFNVSSITDNGAGDYTLNFTVALANANFAVMGSVETITPTSGNTYVLCTRSASGFATGSVRVLVKSQDPSTTSDQTIICAAVFGD